MTRTANPTGCRIAPENQTIDQWAQHGVEELTEREAEEQAELGVTVDEPADD